jgi:predicted PurR-regulated permease PerM
VVTGAPLRRSGAAFGIICAILLTAGLIGLLVLNTALAQGSFVLHDLKASSDQLTDTQDALNQSLAASKSPANLATRAAGMGLVPAQSSAFLRLSDGKVVGVAKPALAVPGFTVARSIASAPAVQKPVKVAER